MLHARLMPAGHRGPTTKHIRVVLDIALQQRSGQLGADEDPPSVHKDIRLQAGKGEHIRLGLPREARDATRVQVTGVALHGHHGAVATILWRHARNTIYRSCHYAAEEVLRVIHGERLASQDRDDPSPVAGPQYC